MLNFALIFSFFIWGNYKLPTGEPRIECTVIKVKKQTKAFGRKKFPELYSSIYNDDTQSKLYVGSKEFPQLNPKTLSRSDTLEKISIQQGTAQLVLEIHGRPISRNGKLSLNGEHLADITCH